MGGYVSSSKTDITEIESDLAVVRLNQAEILITQIRQDAENAVGVDAYTYSNPDVISDNTGHANTIDNGASNAGFDTDHYGGGFVNHLHTYADSFTDTSGVTNEYSGIKFTTKAGVVITKIVVVKHSGCTTTEARILDASKSELATATFSGDTATITYTLAANTTYYLTSKQENFDRKMDSSYPDQDVTGAVDTHGGINQGSDLAGYWFNWASVDWQTGTTSGTVQTNSLASNGSEFYFLPKGTDITNATFNYSSDGGAWTEFTPETWVTLSWSTSLELQIILTGSQTFSAHCPLFN